MGFVPQDLNKMLGEQIKEKIKHGIIDMEKDDDPDIEDIKMETGNIINSKHERG